MSETIHGSSELRPGVIPTVYAMPESLQSVLLEKYLTTGGEWLHDDGETRNFNFDLSSLANESPHDQETALIARQLADTISFSICDVSRMYPVDWVVFMHSMAGFSTDVHIRTGLPVSRAQEHPQGIVSSDWLDPLPPRGSSVVLVTDAIYSGSELVFSKIVHSLFQNGHHNRVFLSVFASQWARVIATQRHASHLVTLSALDAEKLNVDI